MKCSRNEIGGNYSSVKR